MTLKDYVYALSEVAKGNLDFGYSSGGIAWIKLVSADGTSTKYFFVSNTGKLRVSTTEPVLNTDGSLVTGTEKTYGPIAVLTTGTTPVAIFGDVAPVALKITSVISYAQDTTAGNIVVKNGADTVVTIAKGTTAGVPVAGVSLANKDVAKGAVFTVESSSPGNSIVVITYEIA